MRNESSEAPSAVASAHREWSSIASGSAVLFGAQLVGNAGFLVAVLILARALGPSGRGTIAFLIVTALVGGRVARMGVGEATTVFAAQRPPARAVLLSNLLLFSGFCGLILAALVAGGLLLVGDARPAGVDEAELVVLVLGVFFAALVDAGYAFVLGCGRLHQQALITGSASWLYALLLVLVWSGIGLTVFRAQVAWTVAQGLRALLLAVVSLCGIGLGRPNLSLLRESVRFGLRAWVGSLASFLNFRTDQILIGFIASEATLGIYAVAVNASEVLLYLSGATAMAILSVTPRSDPAVRVEQTLRAFRSLATITVATIVVAALTAPPLLPIVFGAGFDDSVGPFLWLLPGALGFAAYAVFENALLAASSPGFSSLGPLVSLTVGLVLDLALIPPFGAVGAAAAASAAFLAGGATAVVAYRSRTAFQWGALIPRRGDLDVRPLAARLLRRSMPSRPAS